MATIGRFFDQPDQSFFLFGPRGTGKSTLARERFPNAVRVDLLDTAVFRLYAARPEHFRDLVHTYPDGQQFVVDEVQKAPELLSVVHGLIEEKRGWRFVLTGSSARKLKRTGVDLLAGRAILCTLHPFMAAELEDLFELESALDRGLLPAVVDSSDPERVLRTYASLYLREEVQMEGLVRNVGDFARFLEVISFSHGALLNVTNIARECEVAARTVHGYLSIVEDLLIAFRVPVFTKRAQRATVARSKFYLFDAGVFRSLRPTGPLDRPEEIHGAALEGLVAQHLRAWIAYREERSKLYYWRTRAGSEVDFIVYGPEGFWAIEVKNAARLASSDIRSLRTFHQDYPECRPLLLYRGSDKLLRDGVRCLPVEEFLLQLHPGRALDEGFV